MVMPGQLTERGQRSIPAWAWSARVWFPALGGGAQAPVTQPWGPRSLLLASMGGALVDAHVEPWGWAWPLVRNHVTCPQAVFNSQSRA